jgi:uncharacterized protein
MLRVVLDTNIIVSGLLNPRGAPAAILDSATSEQFRCFLSESVIDEYEEVLARDYLRIDPNRAARFIRALRRVAVLVRPQGKLIVTRDPDDDKVVECAVEAGADFIVTGNTRDFPSQFRGVRVVTPRDFLVILGSLPKPF